MDTNGWSDIGYNWLVNSTTGEIYEGRGWHTIGAHIAGKNTETIGICVIGLDKVDRADNSPAALASVNRLIAECHRLAGRKLPVIGHRDRASTTCPGNELYAWLQAGRPSTPTTPTTPAPGPAQGFTEAIMAQLPTVRQGDGNVKAVKTIQGLINRDGGVLVVDGDWREKTQQAVTAWQARHQVPRSVLSNGHGDGIWGPACWTFALDL